MKEESLAEDLIAKIVWSLERILNDEYDETVDGDGNLELLELGKELGPHDASPDVQIVEKTMRKFLSGSKWTAVSSLKQQRAPQDIERVLRLFLSAEVASEGARDLTGATWEDILLFLHAHFSQKAKIGEVIGELIIKEREGVSSESAGMQSRK